MAKQRPQRTLDGAPVPAPASPLPGPAPATPPPSALVDIHGLAKFLSASPSTASRLVKAKILPAITIPSGRGDRPLVRFDLRQVREAVEQYQKSPKKS